MHKPFLASAVLTIAALITGCAGSSPAMPSLHGAHIDVPAIPLPSATNVVLDASTVDAAGAAECAALGSAATSRTFFDDHLGQWSVAQLAGVGGDLTRQRQLLGNLFVSGYFGGVDLHAGDGAVVTVPSNSPFASLQSLVNNTTSIPVLDAVAGRVLLIANGDAGGVSSSVALLVPVLGQVVTAAQQALGQPGLPADAAALLQSLIASATSTLSAALVGAAGDVGSARRAEEAVAGLITWAGAFYLGLTATTPIAAPTLTC